MRGGWASIFFLFSAFGLCSPAFAEKRVALVIGNSAYQNVSRLINPANDSAAISATFKNTGFDVVELKRDLKANEMRRALRDFSDTVRDADVAIVYYAGHGIEIDGTNYLIPTDATLERDIDAKCVVDHVGLLQTKHATLEGVQTASVSMYCLCLLYTSPSPRD